MTCLTPIKNKTLIKTDLPRTKQFKEKLETQSKIEVKCTKQNLKSEFEHELKHQTLMQTEIINIFRHQIEQLGAQL